MNIPRRIEEVIDRKNRLLESLRSGLDEDVMKLQESLFNDLIQKLIPEIDVKDGFIVENEKNFRLLTDVDKLFGDFRSAVYDKLLPSVNKAVNNLVNISKDYFTISLGEGNLKENFLNIIRNTKRLTDMRLGLEGGKIVRGGFLWSLVQGGTDNTSFKQFLSRAITAQLDMKDFVAGIKDIVLGTEDKSGMFDRQFHRYAYDVFQQYDAAYNAKFAEEFGLAHFVYQGGLVKDSRDFCIAHNGKVFTTKEAETWKTWTPNESLKKNEFPAGYEPVDNLYETPGYMNYDGYDPLVDRGGYNCRHILGYITEELAKKLRPDLKEKKAEVVVEKPPEFEEYKDLATIQEAEKYAHEELGIKDVSFYDMNNKQMPIINALLRSVQWHFQRYPSLRMEMQFVGSTQGGYRLMKDRIYEKLLEDYIKKGFVGGAARTLAKANASKAVGRVGKNTWAESIGYVRGVGVNSKWSVEVLEEAVKRCEKNKWHATGCNTFKSIFDHEMGHRFDKLLALSVEPEMQEYFKSVKALAGKDFNSMRFFEENLSQYPWTRLNSSTEFIAEAWAEYLNNPKPREIARRVGQIIEKKYKNRFIKQVKEAK